MIDRPTADPLGWGSTSGTGPATGASPAALAVVLLVLTVAAAAGHLSAVLLLAVATALCPAPG